MDYGNYFDEDDSSHDDLFGNSSSDNSKGIDKVKKAIDAMLSDKLLPKSVVAKLNTCTGILNNKKEEMQLKINKVHDILNEITEDSNLPAFVKTQVWNIASILETIDE